MQLLPNRHAGLERLKQFASIANQYPANRNYDLPAHENVSLLSRYIKHRLVTEQQAIHKHYTSHPVQKFINQILWRTYFKGYLQQRPTLWNYYCQKADTDWKNLTEPQRRLWLNATSAKTGLDCYDYWTNELRKTGYLHNHARMWFASIWIFTFELPWTLGARFFHHNLLDGDAAANTLSWRWVAGLHTKGKNYLAQPDNIKKYTQGRFNPVNQLSEKAPPLTEDIYFPIESLQQPPTYPLTGNVGLLLTEEDLNPHSQIFQLQNVNAIAALDLDLLSPSFELAENVKHFSRNCIRNSLSELSDSFQIPIDILSADNFKHQLVCWINKHSIDSILILEPAVGPWQPVTSKLRDILRENNIPCSLFRRQYDNELWPLATDSYFRFLKKAQKKQPALTSPK